MADINLGVGGANSATGGYDIDNSVKTEAGNQEWFYRNNPTQGNRQTFTFSLWHKRTQITGYPADPYLMSQGSNARFHITGNTNPTLRFMWDGNSTELESSPRIRDTAAWYHIVLAVDTTQATASNRVKLYVNGEQISWDNSGYPSQNSTSTWMSTTDMYFNVYNGDGAYDASGYYAEICVIDGQQLAPTSFGEFDSVSGIWKPIDVSGLTFGNEGFYLDFEDSSDLGADVSGNNNDCTLNNIAAADQATDTPTNNFAVLNTLHNIPDTTRKEGATATVKNNNSWRTIVSTLGVSSGKWYFEMSAGSEYTMVGVAGDAVFGGGTANQNYIGAHTGSIGYYGNTATFYQDGVDKSPTNVSGFVADDIIGFAFDADNKKIYFHKNGTYQNSANPNTSSNGYSVTGDAPFFLGFATYQQADQCEANFGGYHVYSISSGNSDANGYGNFEYAVPSGYYALCTKNLAEYG